jgi:outer membrane cobalamin receptor
MFGAAFGQVTTYEGVVTSTATNETLPGATVMVKGTTDGVATDINGRFSIQASPGDILVISFIGMKAEDVSLGKSTNIRVELKTGVALDEFVVTGQGVGMNKRRISSTITTIDSKELAAVPAVQLDQLIQSKIPNAQIKLSSGQPGTASIIRTRGPVSAVTNTTPVIFIDGIRMDNLNSNPQLGIATGGAQSSAIADIPLGDIDRIEYIPGGAATTLYGADAANGVLQIFTKRGKAGNNYVNFELQLGAISGTRDFLRYERTADAIFEPGLLQNYRFGFGGGGAKTNYSFSANLHHDDSFNDLNETVRRNIRSTMSSQINDWLTYSTSFTYSNMEFNRDYNANTAFARFGNLEGGAYGDLDLLTQAEFDDLTENLRLEGESTDIKETINRFQFANNFKFNISDALKASFDIGIDSRSSEQREGLTNELLILKGSFPEGTTNQGEITVASRNFNVLTSNLNFQHNYEVENWSFISTLGGQIFRENDVQRSITANEVVDGSVSINNSASQTVTDFFNVFTSYGIYVAENLGYKNFVYLDLGLRFDGNSAFGDEIGLIALPKIGASVIVSDIPGIKDKFGDIVTFIKVRGNYGQSSIFPRAFANQRTFNGPPYLGSLSFNFANPGDPNLTSEIASTTEFGLDLGFFQGKINLGFTYYNTLTEGALFTPPPIPSSGQQAQLRNVGEIQNSGIEIALNYEVLNTSKHSLNVALSYNYNDNFVNSTGGAPEFAVGGFTFLGAFVGEGQPLGYLRGNQTTLDPDGNAITERNAFLGTTFSPTFGSFSLTYTYNKKWNLFINGDYQTGGSGVNVDDVLRFFGGVADEDRFPVELQDPELGLSFFDLASYWVESTDYVKIRNISLGYTLGDLGKTVKNASVSFSVLNAFNFVASSFDPDATGAGIATQGGFAGGGFGFGTESMPRMFIGSIKFSL